MRSDSSIQSKFTVEFLAQLFSILSMAVIMVFLARTLNPDRYGILFLALSIFSVFSIVATFGLPAAAARYVALYRESEPGVIPYIIKISFTYLLCSAILAGVLLLFSREWIASVLGEPALIPLLVLGIGYVIGSAILAYLRTIFQGFELIRLSSALILAVSVCNVVFIGSLVLLGFGERGALIGFVLAYGVAALLGVLWLVRTVDRFQSVTDIDLGLKRRILEYSVPITFTQAADVLDKHIDTILVGFFLTPVAVSYYVISKQFVRFVEVPASALGFSVSPSFGSKKAADNTDSAARLYERSIVYLLALYLPAAAGLAILAEPIIRFTVGTAYLGAVPVLQILTWFVVVHAVMRVTSTGLDYLGRARVRAIAKGVTAVGNFFLNIILIPELGVIGAAIATVITYTLYAGSNVYVISTELPLRHEYLLKQSAVIVVITGAMAIAVGGLLSYVTDLVTLIGVIAIGSLVWLALSSMTGLLDWREIGAR